jgi:hypothetical protein
MGLTNKSSNLPILCGNVQVFSVPMVVAYPAIATLSGMALWVIVAIVSCSKNVFTVRSF